VTRGPSSDPEVVPYKVTKYRCTKAFKSVVRVGYGLCKRRDGLSVSIMVRVVIRHKFLKLLYSPKNVGLGVE